MSSRLGPLFFLVTLLSQCGSHVSSRPPVLNVSPPSRVGPARHIALHPGEHLVLPAGSLRAGDTVACRLSNGTLSVTIPKRPSGQWAVGKSSNSMSGRTGSLKITSTPNGGITASCTSS